MIDEILITKTPDQKPRFFLHDEVKAWLKDNLEISVQLKPLVSQDNMLTAILQRDLGYYQQPAFGFTIESKVMLDGDCIAFSGSTVSTHANEQLTTHFLVENTKIKQRFEMLESENANLKRRLDLLENPLPI